MTLTDELGDVPPPSHPWTAPVVEDMLQEARAGLTEAVVIGPGRAILFYGRHSMGEGLKADEARDATFLLTGAGTWVGKPAYLTTNLMTVQEGRRAIVHAVLDNTVKARGPGHPNGLLEAEGAIGDKRTSDLGHPGFLSLPQTVVSKAIGVHCPWHLQCHPGWTAQMDPDIPDGVGGIEKKCI